MQRNIHYRISCRTLSTGRPCSGSANDTTPAGEAAAPAPTPFEVAKDLAAKGRLDKALAQLDLLAAKTPEEAGVERAARHHTLPTRAAPGGYCSLH